MQSVHFVFVFKRIKNSYMLKFIGTEWIIQPVVNLFITDKSCIGDKHKFLANSVGMLADTLDFLAYPLPGGCIYNYLFVTEVTARALFSIF